MGLLDRLKPQPRWKHVDPAIRAAGVQELPDEEQDLLASIARSDPDPRVRRTAVSKLGNVAVLTDIARQDDDADVRDEVSGVLLDIALGAYEADEAASLAAVAGLSVLPPADAQKQLVLVAKTARREPVCRRALDALGDDQRSLGTTARRAEQAAIRLQALARVTDASELVATAVKTEYKDVALGALDRLSADEAAVRAVAARARNAAAQRRARAMVRALEDQAAAAARAEAERAAAQERRRRAQRDLLHDIEALASVSDWRDAASRLERLSQRWRDIADDADPELQGRVASASASVAEAVARQEREWMEAQRAAQARAAGLEQRAALCARAEALRGGEVESGIEALRAEWTALSPLEGGDDPALARRFEAGCRGAVARSREAAMQEQTLDRLDALCAELDTLAADASFPARSDLRARWSRLREEWRSALDPVRDDERAAGRVERWAALEAQIAAREAAVGEAGVSEERDAVATGERAAQALERLATIPDATLKAFDRALRDARGSLEKLEALSRTPERDAIRTRLEQALPPIVARAQELREADDWQRWANAGVQEQLIAKMEALAALEDPAEAARQMRQLQTEWQKVAAGPREQGQALWRRFKAAQDAVRARTDSWFTEQARLRGEHLEKKLALCSQAEALAESTDWIATAEAIKALQAEWKTVGPGPRKEEQAAWERFRAACDRFFTRRHEDLAKRKHAWSENLARKEALCQQAESLASSTDWDRVAAELRRLQNEWKTIGPVKKNRSEAIWQRFRSACDAFFERYKQRHSIDLAARVASREAVAGEAEALAQSVTATDGDASAPTDEAVLAELRRLKAAWTHAPTVPREAGAALTQRFEQALTAIIGARPATVSATEFDVAANRRRLEDLVGRAERLAGPAAAAREAVSPAALLATQLREALAANTIGGRVDDDSKWRSAEHELRQLQSAWTEIGFVPDAELRPLATRFQRASQRFYDQREHRRRQFASRT
jgi:hypothetical protein